MRPSREGKKGVQPEGDESLMFPLEMEEQTWRRPISKNLSTKEPKHSNGVGRSQPMDINKRTPIKNIPIRSVAKKIVSERAPPPHDPKINPNGYSDSSNLAQKKPSRPHHFALSDEDDDNYDLDPEADEATAPLPPPSPAELKVREQQVAIQRQKHLHEIEVPRSQSPLNDIQFLCAEMKQKKQQLTVPCSPSDFVKQVFEKQKTEITTSDTAVTIVLPTVPEELNTAPSKMIIKNALAIAVREAKEKKLQATVTSVPIQIEKKEEKIIIPINKDPKPYYSDSDEDQPWVDLPMKNGKKKKKKKKEKIC